MVTVRHTLLLVLMQQAGPSLGLSLRRFIQKVTLGGMIRSSNSSSSKPTTTPSVQGYIPDGLTPREYAQLKEKEAKREAKRDYGAWGPRFAASSEAPDGDWMTMPHLWTQGIPSNFGGTAKQQSAVQQKRRQQRNAQLVAFFLALTVVHTISWSVATAIVRQNTVKMLLLNRKHCLSWVAGNTLLAVLLTQGVAQRFLEAMHRRHLCSRRLTLIATCLVALLWNLTWNAFVFLPF